MTKLRSLWKSNCAEIRMQQRAVSNADVEYVCRYARVLFRARRVFFVLRQKDIPPEDLKFMARLNGTVVLLDRRERIVITVFRDQDAWKLIHKQPKWRSRCRK